MFRFVLYYVTVCCQNRAYLRPPFVLILSLFSFCTEKKNVAGLPWNPVLALFIFLTFRCTWNIFVFFSLSVNNILWRHFEITDWYVSLIFVCSYLKQSVNRGTFLDCTLIYIPLKVFHCFNNKYVLVPRRYIFHGWKVKTSY